MKNIKFKDMWRDVIAQFDAPVRDEIYAAIAAYSLEGRVPAGLTDLARGAFAFIRAEIDLARRRSEKVREARTGRQFEPQPTSDERQAPVAESTAANDAVPASAAVTAPEPAPGPVHQSTVGPVDEKRAEPLPQLRPLMSVAGKKKVAKLGRKVIRKVQAPVRRKPLGVVIQRRIRHAC